MQSLLLCLVREMMQVEERTKGKMQRRKTRFTRNMAIDKCLNRAASFLLLSMAFAREFGISCEGAVLKCKTAVVCC